VVEGWWDQLMGGGSGFGLVGVEQLGMVNGWWQWSRGGGSSGGGVGRGKLVGGVKSRLEWLRGEWLRGDWCG
jgi:hypothetical protein